MKSKVLKAIVDRARKIVTNKVIPKLLKMDNDRKTRVSLTDGDLRITFLTDEVRGCFVFRGDLLARTMRVCQLVSGRSEMSICFFEKCPNKPHVQKPFACLLICETPLGSYVHTSVSAPRVIHKELASPPCQC